MLSTNNINEETPTLTFSDFLGDIMSNTENDLAGDSATDSYCRSLMEYGAVLIRLSSYTVEFGDICVALLLPLTE